MGWLARVPGLTDWNGDGIPMSANTALMAAAGGAALVLLNLGKNGTALPIRVLGLMVALMGSARLFQHLSGIQMHYTPPDRGDTAWAGIFGLLKSLQDLSGLRSRGGLC